MKLLGMELHTDCEELIKFLDGVNEVIDGGDFVPATVLEKPFPGLVEAINKACVELHARRLVPARMTYFNYRVQVYAGARYDADPSTTIRVIPAGITV